MAYKLTRKEKAFFRKVAKYYGCNKVEFDDHPGGTWEGKFIRIGDNGSTFKEHAICFCHELGHFINWKTGKYPIYHQPGIRYNLLDHFGGSIHRTARYALQAEVYTEKVGKQICKFWFPNIEYKAYYKNTQRCLEFLVGYYI